MLAHPPQPVENELAAGWQAAVDPSSGQTYYQNHVTHATQWTKPTAEDGMVADTPSAGGVVQECERVAADLAVQHKAKMSWVRVRALFQPETLVSTKPFLTYSSFMQVSGGTTMGSTGKILQPRAPCACALCIKWCASACVCSAV